MSELSQVERQFITDAMYIGLFGFKSSDANQLLGLPAGANEYARRQAMGAVAVAALRAIESKFNDILDKMPVELKPLMTTEEQCKLMAKLAHAAGGHFFDKGLVLTGLLSADTIS